MVFISKNNIIDNLNNGDIKICKAKSWAKLTKFKNMVKPDLLTKSKLLVKSNFKLDFFIFKTWLTFDKLRQIFIKKPIFHFFNSKYYIKIQIDISSYTISKVFSQLILNNLV